MFTTDDHYLIGSMHVTAGKPCQDHALSGMYGDTAYAIVSDGCSSGGLTDVGARLVSLSTSSAIQASVQEKSSLLAECVNSAQNKTLLEMTKLLRVETADLLATCLYVCLTPSGGFVSVRGDGAVALKWIDGSITLHLFNWPNSTPFYPAYIANDTQSFVDTHGGDPSACVLEEEVWSYAPERGFALLAKRLHSIKDGMAGIIVPIAHIKPLLAVAVFSDGVSQVEHVDWKDVVKELLAFKSVEGAFAKRRMIRFVQDSRKIGKGPIDDIAYAVIRTTQEKEGDAW